MHNREVVEILSTLASGANPITGELFEEDSPYNHPTVIRALFGSIELIEARSGRVRRSLEEINRQRGRPLRNSMRWSEEEEQQLLELLELGTSTFEIASRLQRTQGAIHSRLQGQGLVERDELLRLSSEELLPLLKTRLAARAEGAGESEKA